MAYYPPLVLPDTGGALRQLGEDFVSAMNARTQREFAENSQRRESARDAADRAKQAREDARQEMQDRIQLFHALPQLRRMANNDVNMANANPYGAHYEQTSEPQAPIVSPLPMLGPQQPTAAPLQGPTPGGEPLEPPQEPAPLPEVGGAPVPTQIIPRPPITHLYEMINGQRNEVPPEAAAPMELGKNFGETYDYILQQDPNKDPYRALGIAQGMVASREKADALAAENEAKREHDEEMNLNREDKLAKDQAKLDEDMAKAQLRAKKGGKGGGAFAPGSKQWVHEEDKLGDELKNFQDKHGIWGKEGLGTHIRDLDTSLVAAKKNPNGQEQLQILDKMIRAATGLGVRNQSLQLYASHLGGLRASLANTLEKYKTGKIAPEAWQTVVDTLGHNLADVKKQRDAEQADFEKAVSGSEAYKRHPDLVGRRRTEMFGSEAVAPSAPKASTGDYLLDKYAHLPEAQ